MNDVHYLTEDGKAKLLNELEELKKRRKETTLRIEEAIKMGDLSENAEYTDAKEEQAFIEGRFAEIDAVLKNSEMIKEGKRKASDTVTIGSSVTVKLGSSEKTFRIVGTEEADPTQGLISHESPLGKAFLGRKKGEKIAVVTPRGESSYQIVSVS
jgi:transcription elongation factor GreA